MEEPLKKFPFPTWQHTSMLGKYLTQLMQFDVFDAIGQVFDTIFHFQILLISISSGHGKLVCRKS